MFYYQFADGLFFFFGGNAFLSEDINWNCEMTALVRQIYFIFVFGKIGFS